MRIRTVVSPLLGTNVHVVGDPDGPCVVVDAGAEVEDDVLAVVAQDRLRPVAVLLTHGHVDHTWSAGPLCERLGVPLVLHEADVPRLADPLGTLGPLGEQLAVMVGARPPAPPADVRPFAGAPGERVPLDLGAPGVDVVAVPSPGHTEGSTVYLVGETAFTGDVLFAGTIGRTDLPGGDGATMARTLAVLAALDRATTVLPGHGPGSTIARELDANPYLRAAR